MVTSHFSEINFDIFQRMWGSPKLALLCNYQNISRFQRSMYFAGKKLNKVIVQDYRSKEIEASLLK